jgi:hypothetical protein
MAEDSEGPIVSVKGTPEQIANSFSKTKAGEDKPEQSEAPKRRTFGDYLNDLASDPNLRVVVNRVGPQSWKNYSVMQGRVGSIPVSGMQISEIEDKVRDRWAGGEYSALLLDGRGNSLARHSIQIDGKPCKDHLEKKDGEDDPEDDEGVLEEKRKARLAEAKRERLLKEKELQKIEKDDDEDDDDGHISHEEHIAALQRLEARMKADMQEQQKFDNLQMQIQELTRAIASKKDEGTSDALMAFVGEQQKAREESAKERERQHEKEMIALKERMQQDAASRENEVKRQAEMFKVQIEMMKALQGDKKDMFEQAETMISILEKAANVVHGSGEGDKEKSVLGELTDLAKPMLAAVAATQASRAPAVPQQQFLPAPSPESTSRRGRRRTTAVPVTDSIPIPVPQQSQQPDQQPPQQGGQEGQVYEDVSDKVAKQTVNLAIDRLIVEMNNRTQRGIDRIIDIIVGECPGDLVDAIASAESWKNLPELVKPYDVPLTKLVAIATKAEENHRYAQWLSDLWEELKAEINGDLPKLRRKLLLKSQRLMLRNRNRLRASSVRIVCSTFSA